MKGVNKIILLALCFFAVGAQARSVAEKLSGYFQIRNYSVYTNGAWVPKYSDEPKGTIVYIPSYPGALHGNMSVCFGERNQGAEPFSAATVLNSMVAYTGPYEIEPENERVAHRIILITNPYSALTKVGNPNYRWYSFFENDNVLRLFVENGADLYWDRINKLPACEVRAQVNARSGSPTVTGVRVRVQGEISQSWGLTLIKENLYTVNLYSGLATTGSVTPGFVASGTVSVTVVEADCN